MSRDGAAIAEGEMQLRASAIVDQFQDDAPRNARGLLLIRLAERALFAASSWAAYITESGQGMVSPATSRIADGLMGLLISFRAHRTGDVVQAREWEKQAAAALFTAAWQLLHDEADLDVWTKMALAEKPLPSDPTGAVANDG